MVRDYFSIILILHLFICVTISGQTTRIPDPYFERALIDFRIDSDGVINGTVATSDISGVTFLDVSGYNIEFLSGIEDFASLTSLFCHNNLIWTLDLRHNKNLKVLECSDQYDGLWLQPLSLNVTQNIALESLSCHNNEMHDLNLSNNINLTGLGCSGNQLTSLDLSNNTKLKVLDCSNNYSLTLKTGIQSLDISYLPDLLRLNCSDNSITGLDTSQNLNIESLDCNNNQLQSLDLKQNQKLRGVHCNNNLLTYLNVKNDNNSILQIDARYNSLLTCIQVDDAEAANAGEAPYDDWYKDVIASYSEDCSTLGLDDELLSQSISLYPNPVSNILIIDSEIPIIKVEIYSVLGKKVKEVNANFSDIKLSNLSAGLYLIKIYSEKGDAFRKIIKT